jgi:hypothetical protein
MNKDVLITKWLRLKEMAKWCSNKQLASITIKQAELIKESKKICLNLNDYPVKTPEQI